MNDISPLFFYHRVYLNGVQILLEKRKSRKILPNFWRHKNLFEIGKYKNNFWYTSRCWALNQNEFPKDSLSPPIFNFYSKNSNIRERQNRDNSSSIDFSGLKLLNESEKYKLYEYPQKMEEELDKFFSVII